MQTNNKHRLIDYLYKKLRETIVYNLKFFIIFFLIICISCSKKESAYTACLTEEERSDLDYFFRFLMFYDSGAFVLFGSKPLCDSGFFPYVVAKENSPFTRNPMHGWKAWEKIKNHVHPNRYTLLMEQIKKSVNGEIKDFVHFIFIDKVKVALLLAENYEIFRNYVGIDFHPLKVAFEAEEPNSEFWKKILSFNDGMTNGLLFGFGKRNALFYEWRWQLENEEGKLSEFFKTYSFRASISNLDSTHFGPWTPETLFIPGYVAFDGDETVIRYEKERDTIKKIYKGQDFLELTLEELAK